MSDVKDYIGDLAHHIYDTVTGVLSPASAPSKPAATLIDASQHLGTGIAAQGADTIKNRKSQIEQAVDDAS